MAKKIKRIWNAVTTVLVGLVLILAVLLAGARLFGLQVFTVLSGSMEPKYHTGSVIYVREVDYREVEVGQVITFMLDENTVATHRVVEIVPDEEEPGTLRYRTKGDANDAVDGGLVHYKNIIGSPVGTIPYLGYVASLIQNPPGSYVAISLGALLLMLVFLPDLLFTEPEEEKPKETVVKKKRRKGKKPWYRRSLWYRTKQQPTAVQPTAVQPTAKQPTARTVPPQQNTTQRAQPVQRPAPQTGNPPRPVQPQRAAQQTPPRQAQARPQSGAVRPTGNTARPPQQGDKTPGRPSPEAQQGAPQTRRNTERLPK